MVDLLGEINARIQRQERVLVTTLTKKMAEDLTDYLTEQGIKVKYMHHEVDTFERMEIIKDLRLGSIDVVVGINLLREGLDLPEVSLVAILDADKEGFLRSETSLIQTIGRAARNAEGMVIMYADVVTDSMERAITETERRRAIQMAYNEEHGIVPKTIVKAIADSIEISDKAENAKRNTRRMGKMEREAAIERLTREMKEAAKLLELSTQPSCGIRSTACAGARTLPWTPPPRPSANRTMHRHNEKGENTLANDKIIIKGAREHNLKNINLTLPREKLIVMTGLSGSGKSSLAFDTIYADGQRRYVESLSSYARMFLGRMDKPDVDEITGLSPAISIDQKTTSHNPRSTVGTVTEIYDYLRLLYARIGVPHCPVCGRVISQQTVDEMVDAVLKLEEGTKFQILAPVVRQRSTQQKELDAARRAGYARVKIDGNLYDLDEEISLEKNIKHTVEIVVDRLALRKGIRSRLADSLETALALTGGVAEVDVIGGECMTFSQNFACPEHGISISDLSPRLFSFNNPLVPAKNAPALAPYAVDEDRILPNRSLPSGGCHQGQRWYYAEGR